MRILSIISIVGLLIAGELEVQGDLKVTGGIDSPTIDALRGDGDYEYIIFFVHITIHEQGYVQKSGYLRIDQDDLTSSANNHTNSMSNFNSEITQLMNDGWKLDSINSGGAGYSYGPSNTSWWIFKRPIEE